MYQKNVTDKLWQKMQEYEKACKGSDSIGLYCIPDKYTEKMLIDSIDKAISKNVTIDIIIPELKAFEDSNILS